MQARYDAKNPDALKRLVAGGARLRPMPRPIMEAAFKASQELYSELSAKNQNWRRIYEDWSKFRADQVLWFRITEREFDNFMAAQRLDGTASAAPRAHRRKRPHHSSFAPATVKKPRPIAGLFYACYFFASIPSERRIASFGSSTGPDLAGSGSPPVLGSGG